MASLRTAFLQATKPNLNPFCSILAYVQPTIPLLRKTDDLENMPDMIQQIPAESSPRPNLFLPLNLFNLAFYHEINNLINQNINSFSQLSDHESNDFKDCDNFVHCLSLEDEEGSDIRLSEMETICSENLNMQTSTGATHRKFFLEDSDFSQVQDFEP